MPSAGELMVSGLMPPGAAAQIAAWDLSPRQRAARIGERIVALTSREYELLRHLMVRAGQSHTSRELLRDVWGYDDEQTATVAVHMRKLRMKLEECPENPRHLITVRGSGYSFQP